eukprot:scaffold147451_cov21-Prasinocladus_malaysianus.AAC.1
MGGDAEGGAGCNPEGILAHLMADSIANSHDQYLHECCFVLLSFAPVVDVVIGVVVIIAVRAVHRIAANSPF